MEFIYNRCIQLIFYMLLSGLEIVLSSRMLSTVEDYPGHYPYALCKITNGILDTERPSFTIVGETKNIPEQIHVAAKIWPVIVSEKPPSCSVKFKYGQAFTIYYWRGVSNYYHLTYDMMIPLYKQLYHDNKETTFKDLHEGEALLMPTVETSRLKKLDWDTTAFENQGKYWVEMVKVMAGNHTFKPLDKTILAENGNICFDELYFGTAAVNFADADLILGFVQFVKSSLGIQENNPVRHRLMLVSRKGRRKILNEKKVVDALQSVIPTDLIEFSGMSFSQQVQTVQKYTVCAALNGAGLMNALYLPKHAVTIQMVPYKAQLNVKQYGTLLKARGPYLEWHNTREDLTQVVPGDQYNSMPNTIVDIEDFKVKVREAIDLYDRTSARMRDEL